MQVEQVSLWTQTGPSHLVHKISVIYPLPRLCGSKSDTSFFIYKHGSDTTYLLLYVDDIVLTASSMTLHCIIASLHAEFAMTDLGYLHYFLGLATHCSSAGLFLSQDKNALELLVRAKMADCNSCAMPIESHSKLPADAGPPVAILLSTAALQVVFST